MFRYDDSYDDDIRKFRRSSSVEIIDAVKSSNIPPDEKKMCQEAVEHAPTIKFNQGWFTVDLEILRKSKDKQEKSTYKDFKKLDKINMKYNGLCELISNYVIMNDLLGKQDGGLEELIAKNRAEEMQLALNITEPSLILKELNKQKVRGSHVLECSTFCAKLQAYLFNIYPHNLIPSAKMKTLLQNINEKNVTVETINREEMQKQLDRVVMDDFVEIQLSSKKLPFISQPMLIKKTGENTFLLSDPKHKRVVDENLSIDDLTRLIQRHMIEHKYNKVVFVPSKIKINQAVVQEPLDKLQVDSYVKVHLFSKNISGFNGHSLVIKKTGTDTFSYFDPNEGEFQNLRINQLITQLQNVMHVHDANEIVFLDAKAYFEIQLKSFNKPAVERKAEQQVNDEKRFPPRPR